MVRGMGKDGSQATGAEEYQIGTLNQSTVRSSSRRGQGMAAYFDKHWNGRSFQ